MLDTRIFKIKMLVNSVSYYLIVVFSLVEIHSQYTVGAVYIPICKSNCKNGYCKHPEECACNAGYTKLKDTCVPVCEGDCSHGICVAPNTCRCISGYKLLYDTCVKEQTSTSSNEDTTTTTKDPFNTIKTNKYYYNHAGTTTTLRTTTTTVPYFVSSSTSTERVVSNDAKTTVTSGDPMEKPWLQQHGMCIWIPIIVIVTTGLILLLVWRRIPMKIVNFFEGRSYNVQGAFLKRNGSRSLGRLEFIPDEWEAQS